jgi:branched-chain amino acid transport system permease protein
VGIAGIKLLVNLGKVKVNFLAIAYMSMVLMLFYLLVVNKILKSRYGLIMATINDDEEVAHGIGVNINKIKILAFINIPVAG